MSSPGHHQLSQSAYATQRKDLLALMSRLRSVGAQTELDLPRIAVIGNQSAGASEKCPLFFCTVRSLIYLKGKSSVVEAISGVSME
jgi:hypothetical protein